MAAKSKHLPAEERRAETVETVIELASEQNPAEITTAAIAKRMNLTQGALFRHFQSKDAIWQAAMEWVAKRLLSRLDKAAEAANSPMNALEAMFMAHIEFVAEHPGVPRMLFGELQRAEDSIPKRLARTLIGHYRERLDRLIEAGKAQGELDAKLDNDAAATLFIGAIQGLIMQSLLHGDIQRMRADAPGAFDILRRGVGGGS